MSTAAKSKSIDKFDNQNEEQEEKNAYHSSDLMRRREKTRKNVQFIRFSIL